MEIENYETISSTNGLFDADSAGVEGQYYTPQQTVVEGQPMPAETVSQKPQQAKHRSMLNTIRWGQRQQPI